MTTDFNTITNMAKFRFFQFFMFAQSKVSFCRAIAFIWVRLYTIFPSRLDGPLMLLLPWELGQDYHQFLQCCQTWKKKQYFVNFKTLGMHIWRGKKRVNNDKFKIVTNCINQIFNLNAFFFFLLTGATWYYLTIYLVFTYFESFIDYEDDIFKLFFICTFKDPNLAENLKESWTLRSSWSLFFPSQLWFHYNINWCNWTGHIKPEKTQCS